MVRKTGLVSDPVLAVTLALPQARDRPTGMGGMTTEGRSRARARDILNGRRMPHPRHRMDLEQLSHRS